MSYWAVHDLRRTARTHLLRLTTADVAEIILGHTLPGVRMTYDRHDYLEEQAAAYKAWFDKLQAIVYPDNKSDNVIPIKRAQLPLLISRFGSTRFYWSNEINAYVRYTKVMCHPIESTITIGNRYVYF